MAKAAPWGKTDAHARKRGEQTGKLKGIDGDPHKRWMMWINSMQREKPYLALTCQERSGDGAVPAREPEHRCCMAVVSSCREMLG